MGRRCDAWKTGYWVLREVKGGAVVIVGSHGVVEQEA